MRRLAPRMVAIELVFTMTVGLIHMATAQNVTAFKLMTSWNGSQLCATGQPLPIHTLSVPRNPDSNSSSCIPQTAKCGMLCFEEIGCIGYNVRMTSRTCELFSSYMETTVVRNASQCVFYAKSDVLDATDCAKILLTEPKAKSGEYTIVIGPDKRLVQVYCDMTTKGGGWTVIQRRQDGSVDFYRKWLEYSVGFGQPRTEFWIGNINIAALTASKRYTLRIELGDWSGTYKYAEYDNFKVAGPAQSFMITKVGNFIGDTADSFSLHKGCKFTTIDQDNDATSEHNCAEYCHGAWWYDTLFGANLNGDYFSMKAHEGIYWKDWLGEDYSLKFTEMKLRAT